MFSKLSAYRIEAKRCVEIVFEDRVLYHDYIGVCDDKHRSQPEHDQKVDYRLPCSPITLAHLPGHFSHLALLLILAAFCFRRYGILL